MSEEREQSAQPVGYEPPQVDDVPAEDGLAVTTAGAGNSSQLAAEWRGEDREVGR